MEYLVKSYRLDEDVVAWLDNLKMLHGSVNKGLRAAMLAARETFPADLKPRGTPIHRSPDLDEHLAEERERNGTKPGYDVASATSVMVEKIPPRSPEGRLRKALQRQEASAERSFKGPLLKPKDRK